MSNHGSKKPLNWNPPVLEDRVEKSSPEWSSEVYTRFGGPLTRRGATNGQGPITPPQVDPQYSDPVNKAVLTPVKYGPGGKPQFQRKRNQDGTFAESQKAGQESTAEEDKTQRERQDRLASARQKEQRRVAQIARERSKTKNVNKNVSQGIPGMDMSGIDAVMPGQNDTNAAQIGVTYKGNPIFDDPYHSAHQEFDQQEHQQAAQLHQQAAQQAMAQGDQAGAMRHQNSVDAHKQLFDNFVAPGQRMAETLATPEMGGNTEPSPMGQNMGEMSDQAMGEDGLDLGGLLGQDDGQMTDNPPVDGMAGPPEYQPNTMGNPPEETNPVQQAPDDLQQLADTPEDPGMGGADAQGGVPEDPMANFLNNNNPDQNKPLGMDMNGGPKPNMAQADTGLPMGEQTTSNAQFSGGQGAGYQVEDGTNPSPEGNDLSGVLDFDELLGFGEENVEQPAPGEPPFPETNAGSPGPMPDVQGGRPESPEAMMGDEGMGMEPESMSPDMGPDMSATDEPGMGEPGMGEETEETEETQGAFGEEAEDIDETTQKALESIKMWLQRQ